MKSLFLITLLFFTSNFCFGIADSSKTKRNFKDKLVFNMGGGLFFNQNFVNINIFPQLGYKITDKLIAGVGANLMYNSINQRNNFIYGGNAFARYRMNESLFLETEFQMLKSNLSSQFDPYWLAGGGYTINSFSYISVYYLLLYPQNNNIYGQPFVIRGGIFF